MKDEEISKATDEINAAMREVYRISRAHNLPSSAVNHLTMARESLRFSKVAIDFDGRQPSKGGGE